MQPTETHPDELGQAPSTFHKNFLDTRGLKTKDSETPVGNCVHYFFDIVSFSMAINN